MGASLPQIEWISGVAVQCLSWTTTADDEEDMRFWVEALHDRIEIRAARRGGGTTRFKYEITPARQRKSITWDELMKADKDPFPDLMIELNAALEAPLRRKHYEQDQPHD